MVVLRVVEGSVFDNLSGDGLAMASRIQRCLVRVFRSLRLLQMRIGVDVDPAAVLRSSIATLSVALCGVVGFPEGLEEVREANLLRIENDLHGLRMARLTRTDFAIRGMDDRSVDVADSCGVDTGKQPEALFSSPCS